MIVCISRLRAFWMLSVGLADVYKCPFRSKQLVCRASYSHVHLAYVVCKLLHSEIGVGVA